MAERGFEMVRYADDFVILCRSRAEAQRALGAGAAVDGGSRPDAASDQDADRGRTQRRALTFWAITFERRLSLAAEEEPGEAQGHDPGEDAAHQRAQPAGDHRAT